MLKLCVVLYKISTFSHIILRSDLSLKGVSLITTAVSRLVVTSDCIFQQFSSMNSYFPRKRILLLSLHALQECSYVTVSF